MKNALLLLASLGGILAAVLWWTFRDFDASQMSIHGWIAMAIGVVVSLLLGGGLMALVFFSARRGYDDRVPRFDPDEDS